MSENLNSGFHPNPDSLSAFIEGALPEHERLACLSHLADCADCREIVFLAQEPLPELEELVDAKPTPIPASRWPRWFSSMPVMSAAAALCVALIVTSVFVRRTQTMQSTVPVDVIPPATQTAPATPMPQSPPNTADASSPPHVVASKANPVLPRAKRISEQSAQSAPTALLATDSPPASASPGIALPPATPLPSPGVKQAKATEAALAAVSGAVTDVTGAPIANATVALHLLDAPSITDARTDTNGQFAVTGLPPGQYQMHVVAPGFQSKSKKVDLSPKAAATVNSELSVGSMSETVQVTAAEPALRTMPTTRNGTLSEAPATLGAPPDSATAVNGKVMLRLDSGGTLLLSRNKGKTWSTVKPAWPEKVTKVISLPAGSVSFQLTTESGVIWLSHDGSKWHRSVPPKN